jgi:prepilin-type N-terminal cleavage/methylation domain-containing protein
MPSHCGLPFRTPAARRAVDTRRRLRAQDGYTFVELLVVLAILGTVLAALGTAFVGGLHAEVMANNRFRAQIQARIGLNELRRDVHCASVATATTSSLTLTLPAPPPGTTPCPTGTGQFTWCTIGAGTRWALYRVPGATCTSTGGIRYADYLISANVFPLPTYTAPTATTYAKLHVELPVNVQPPRLGTYDLTDDIVLRNSSRTS